MDFDKVLNKPQTEAVTHVDGPLLILAGAGSGKTRVLTHRIAYLIQEIGVHPWNILAITFTNKAASEMKSRVEKMLGEQSVNIWVSTFHSCCVRILRSEIERYGYNRNFTIYDADDSESLIKKCLKELNIDEKHFAPRMVKEAISRAKDELQTPADYLRLNAGDFRIARIAAIYTLYQSKLKISNAVDFDDLIMLTVNLFADFPDVLQKYSTRFKYVMVDEYQDTNTAQYMLIRSLCSHYGNLCVVGDDDQSIYGWRGANIRNILDFETDFPDCKVIKLEQNYRSTKNILDAANKIIAHNKSRKSKTLFTSNNEGQKVINYTAENEKGEGSFIVSKIRELMRTNEYAYSDFAVLYRTNAQSRILEYSIVGTEIPYRIYGGLKFFERKEVKDLLAYLRLIYNPDDDISFLRAVNTPRRGIGDVTIEKIAALAKSGGCSMLRAIKGGIDQVGVGAHMVTALKEFADMIFDCVAEKDRMELPDFIKFVIGKSGVIEALNNENTEESNERAKNVLELLSIAVEYEKEEDFDEDKDKLEGYLERATLDAGTGGQDEAAESVTLMTLHSAKGLEYKIVFIAGMEEGIFPSPRSTYEQEKLEEERRLCYVGITRAKKELYFLNTKSRTLYGKTTSYGPSQFISEIPDEFLENANERGVKKSRPPLRPAGAVPDFGRAPEAVLQNIAWKKGDVVEHAKFGRGIITEAVKEANDFKLTIEFESSGMKRIMASFAHLQKLN